MLKKYFAIGAINAGIAIALGAFGAHGLQDIVSERMLANFETGVRYHMYSALGLMLVSIIYHLSNESKKVKQGARLICAGTFIFSGSLYTMALTGLTILGAITPIGGVLLILGWIFVTIGVLRPYK